jgi:hypothetical protein
MTTGEIVVSLKNLWRKAAKPAKTVSVPEDDWRNLRDQVVGNISRTQSL